MAKRPAPEFTEAVVYLRVSTGKQADSGLGLEAQEAKCREYCASRGLSIQAVFKDEAVSGREDVASRTALGWALELVEASPRRVLVAYSLSRLSRSQRVTWQLLDDRGGRGVPFSSASEAFDTSTPMGRAMLGMIGVWSQLEADATSERTRDALAAARAGGKRLGALTMIEKYEPAGVDAYGKQRYRRVVDPEKVAVIRLIQNEARKPGCTAAALALGLNMRGIRSPTGKHWHARTVRVAVGIKLPEAL